MLMLLGTSGCHLCDQAEQLLQQAAAARALQWEYRDIALDEQLVERYGMKIPVLLADDGRELAWPFSLLDILRLAA
jgi:thiol-disulfide isomerase/thioredoxin